MVVFGYQSLVLVKKVLISSSLAVSLWSFIAFATPAAAADNPPPLGGIFADNFILSDPPRPAPLGAFTNLAGKALTLADFRGSLIVLNFWATWCAPCRQEMPSLDRLQTLLGPEGLKVIALSLDRAGNAAVTAFMEELGLTSMEAFLDSGNQSARDFVVQGLPATFIIDPSGGLVGGLLGPAEWDSPDALMLLRHYLPGSKWEGKQDLLRTSG